MIRDTMKNFDFVIASSVAIIFCIGLLFLYSAANSLSGDLSNVLMTKQIAFMFSGLVIAGLIFVLDYRRLIDISWILYAGSCFLLLVVLFWGSRRLGAQRWIGIGSFGLQPSEFIKITFILALAAYLGRRKDSIESSVNIFIPALLFAIPFILIAIQPDLGTALVLIPIFVSMIFVAGVNVKPIIFFFTAGILSTPFLWHLLHDYQKKRLLVFINPDIDPLGAGYTIIQSKIAIGSGGLFGKGWLSGTQSQLNFLPERHTDFIFSVVGEEWGFIGGAILILLYFIVISRGIRIISTTNDYYGKIITTGIIAMFSFQVIVNIGMTLGLLPVVGLTLPFISYGGSSIISSVVAIAILLNISSRRPLF